MRFGRVGMGGWVRSDKVKGNRAGVFLPDAAGCGLGWMRLAVRDRGGVGTCLQMSSSTRHAPLYLLRRGEVMSRQVDFAIVLWVHDD